MTINWTAISTIFTAVSSCATAISIIILVITLFYLNKQIREMRLATYATAYKAAVDIMQSEEVRSARRYLFAKLNKKPFESWNEKDKQEAEKVCFTYDSVGQMVRYGFLPKKYIIDSWGASLRKSWPILSPLILAYRHQKNSAEFWDDFEWLAKEARLFQKPLI